ncbi:MAG: hypothetical protein HC802_07715 [Caldilineaceae bacterium]|nr:hypothetical protein [Caldilineaceae bacterium]
MADLILVKAAPSGPAGRLNAEGLVRADGPFSATDWDEALPNAQRRFPISRRRLTP